MKIGVHSERKPASKTTMRLGDALKGAGVSVLTLAPGDVCVVADKAVVIPEAKNRDWHETRTCVVLSNDTLCADVFTPIVTIAPTSSRIDLKGYSDFFLANTRENGLSVDSLVMLGHVQPVRKIDLVKKIGYLTLDEWERMLAHLLRTFDRA